MSRLYGKISSDRRKTDATAGANYSLQTKLTWGSASDPRKAATITLTYPKDKNTPCVNIFVPSDIRHVIAVGHKQVSQKLDE